MGLEIRLTKRAEEDLNEIFAYIAQDNPEAAERFAQKLLKRTEVLRTFPEAGKTFRKRAKIRRLIEGQILILYAVDREARLIEIRRF
jgi:plasmid stabilization system protein ParE